MLQPTLEDPGRPSLRDKNKKDEKGADLRGEENGDTLDYPSIRRARREERGEEEGEFVSCSSRRGIGEKKLSMSESFCRMCFDSRGGGCRGEGGSVPITWSSL